MLISPVVIYCLFLDMDLMRQQKEIPMDDKEMIRLKDSILFHRTMIWSSSSLGDMDKFIEDLKKKMPRQLKELWEADISYCMECSEVHRSEQVSGTICPECGKNILDYERVVWDLIDE